MDARLRISGGDEVEEIASLRDWLRDEPAVRGLVQPVSEPIGPAELSGGIVTLLTVALGSGGAGAALAGSLTTWLQTRRPTVKLTVSAKDRTAELHAHRIQPQQVDETLAILRSVLTDDQDS